MEARLNCTWNMLSAGTRVLILQDPNEAWDKPGDTVWHGYATVALRSPSYKLLEKEPRLKFPFDIELDYLTPIRNMSDTVPEENRHNRRKAKQEAYNG